MARIHCILMCDPDIPNKLCLLNVCVKSTKSDSRLVVSTPMDVPAAVTDGDYIFWDVS